MRSGYMKSMKVNGFTLIEVIVVLVILGVLAATAAQKLIDLQGQATATKLEDLGGKIRTAMKMASAKAYLQGVKKNRAGVKYVCVKASCPEVAVNDSNYWQYGYVRFVDGKFYNANNASTDVWKLLLDLDVDSYTVKQSGLATCFYVDDVELDQCWNVYPVYANNYCVVRVEGDNVAVYTGAC